MTRVLVGYDGSPASAAAIDVASRLFPAASANVVHLWTPPFADNAVRARLRTRAKSLDELVQLIEHEGAAAAERLAANGVTLARAAGWDADALVQRTYGGEGYELARLAEQHERDVLVVGSRGLGGVSALLGSTSDVAVHVSAVPVLVIPDGMLAEEREAASAGPIVVGYDGSSGSQNAVTRAASLFEGRGIIIATVGELPDDGAALPEMRTAERVSLDEARGEGAVADRLARLAAQRRAAVIAVGSRGRSATREILLGSVAMGVLHRAHRPVLVVPYQRLG